VENENSSSIRAKSFGSPRKQIKVVVISIDLSGAAFMSSFDREFVWLRRV
jgi:hypothetical protein